jgi:hypothetical protein
MKQADVVEETTALRLLRFPVCAQSGSRGTVEVRDESGEVFQGLESASHVLLDFTKPADFQMIDLFIILNFPCHYPMPPNGTPRVPYNCCFDAVISFLTKLKILDKPFFFAMIKQAVHNDEPFR